MSDQVQDIDWGGKKARRIEIKAFVRKFLLCPSFWKDNQKHVSGNLNWQHVPFNEQNILNVPTGRGVYCFIMIPPTPNNFWKTKYLFYVGKAAGVSLRARFKNYLNEKKGIGIGLQKARIKVEEMLNDFEGYLFFYYSVSSDIRKIEETEEKLLNTFMPYVNTSIPEAKISEEYRHIY